MEKLKPCPFCGGNVKKRKGLMTGTIMFICEKCGADVCFYGAEGGPKATKAWNRRDGNAEIEKLKYERMYYMDRYHERAKTEQRMREEAIKEFAERLKPSNAKRYISYAKVERLVKEMTEEKDNEKND